MPQWVTRACMQMPFLLKVVFNHSCACACHAPMWTTAAASLRKIFTLSGALPVPLALLAAADAATAVLRAPSSLPLLLFMCSCITASALLSASSAAVAAVIANCASASARSLRSKDGSQHTTTKELRYVILVYVRAHTHTQTHIHKHTHTHARARA